MSRSQQRPKSSLRFQSKKLASGADSATLLVLTKWELSTVPVDNQILPKPFFIYFSDTNSSNDKG